MNYVDNDSSPTAYVQGLKKDCFVFAIADTNYIKYCFLHTGSKGFGCVNRNQQAFTSFFWQFCRSATVARSTPPGSPRCPMSNSRIERETAQAFLSKIETVLTGLVHLINITSIATSESSFSLPILNKGVLLSNSRHKTYNPCQRLALNQRQGLFHYINLH